MKPTKNATMYWRLLAALFCIFFSVALLLVNLYGEFSNIRKEGLGYESPEFIRFDNDKPLSYEDSIKKLESIPKKSDRQYAYEANQIVQQSLAHIEWKKVDPVEYRQRIPIWENYFLYFAGELSNLPQFERYHFVDYKRSIKRGIGICGDASMVLSQVLDNANIQNHIVSFDQHVITEAILSDGEHMLLDPDFGIIMNIGLDELIRNPEKAYSYYIKGGFNKQETMSLVHIYKSEYKIFDDVYSFMSKRYIFEYTTYFIKWPLPIILLFIGYKFARKKKINKST